MGPITTAYLAADGFLPELLRELGGAPEVLGRLVVSDAPARPAAWAANVWLEPRIVRASSIGEAARGLRAIQRGWALYSHRLHRRGRLIVDRLPHVSGRPLRFPEPPPAAPLGSFTLLDAETLLASARCSSPFPHGEARFVEDRDGPPSRAYLKLWEAFTRLGAHPRPGELCLDLGSSPGGWTWACQRLGARVVSVDKAELDPAIASLPGVEHRRQSAFAIDPAELGPIDWVLCDVACYPRRLLTLVERFLDAGHVRRFVCTIKLQGETDHAAVAAFAAIPGSTVAHLHHNRHELTWTWGS